jgi:predicted nucleotidyltransferase
VLLYRGPVIYTIGMSTVTRDRQDVIRQIQVLQPRLRELGVVRLALFGSFCRGEQRDDSDVDLLAEFAPGKKSFDNFMAVCDLLEASLQRRVELLTRESLSPHIGPRILQEAEDVVAAG